MKNINLDGNYVLDEALKNLDINLIDIIANVAIWASPEVVKSISQPIYPDRKRGKGKFKKGEIVNGIILDDNSYANSAAKRFINGKIKFVNFQVCHVWPYTAYDERYYTHLANLVLIPRSIASLTDHSEMVIEVLKYRSFELFGWWPDSEKRPIRPTYYPVEWKDPIHSKENLQQCFGNSFKRNNAVLERSDVQLEIEKVKRKLPRWKDSGQVNDRILKTYLTLYIKNQTVSLLELEKKCKDLSFNKNFPQMKNISRKNHGKVFDVINGFVYLWEPIKNDVLKIYGIVL